MSGDILARHERDGDISRSEAGYFCNVCPAALGQQPLPHLQGTNHTNAVFLLTLSQPSRNLARYRDIPERIRTALVKGEIVAKEKKVMCTICNVPLAKEKTVSDHLSSSNHVTKVWVHRGTFQLTSSPSIPHESLPQPFRQSGAPLPPFTSPLVPDESGLDLEAPSMIVERTDSIVTRALRNGYIKTVQGSGTDGFMCNICASSKVITGDAPMRQHLLGKQHLISVMKHEHRQQQPSGAVALPQPPSPPSWDVEQDQVPRPSFVDQVPRPSFVDQVPQPSYMNQVPRPSFVDQVPRPSFVDQVSRPSFVDPHQIPWHQQDPTHSPQNEFNHQQNSQHHQNRSHSHQNEFNYQHNSSHQQNIYQEQRSNPQQYNIVNAFPSLTLNVNVGGSQIPNPMNQNEPSSHSPSTANPFSTNFNPRTSRRQPTSPYKIETSPRGIVVIFNYHFHGQDNQRDGAAEDYQNLRKVFQNMNYDVWPEMVDLTKQQTMVKLDEIRSLPGLAMVDSFIAFFLSHGGGSANSFRTVESNLISVEEIIYTNFTDVKCPQLRRKPKLFFFNFCRGQTEQLQSDSWTPSSTSSTAPKHVAVVQAALPHFKAMRDPEAGTVFVDSLCKILSECAGTLDLHDIVQSTSGLMQERGGTTATPWYIDFGKFYFR